VPRLEEAGLTFSGRLGLGSGSGLGSGLGLGLGLGSGLTLTLTQALTFSGRDESGLRAEVIELDPERFDHPFYFGLQVRVRVRG